MKLNEFYLKPGTKCEGTGTNEATEEANNTMPLHWGIKELAVVVTQVSFGHTLEDVIL